MVSLPIWSLEDLYQGSDDPALVQDQQRADGEALSIAKQYAGQLSQLSGAEVKALVQRLEQLAVKVARLQTYSFLNFTTQTDNAAASALVQQTEELGARVDHACLFFRLEWNQLPAACCQQHLENPVLAPYRHYLSVMRQQAPYQLSRTEEKLLATLSPVGRSSWLQLFEKIFGSLKFGEQGRSEEEVLSDLYHPERRQRQQAADELTQGLSTQQHILTHIFNTLAAEKMTMDRLRGYEGWLTEMDLDNELSQKTVGTLVNAVTSRYDIVQRYYRFKAQLLAVDELVDYDRYAPLPDLPTQAISWEQCQKIVLEAFTDFSPKLAEIGRQFFDKNWIHAPVQPGKRGGAFAHPCVPDCHPYLLVNYTGNLRDVSTVAHELGHGIHQYLAAEQGYYNSDTTLVLSETASVFAELLVFKSELGLLTVPKERASYICQKLESIFATVFRQIAMNQFEEKLHTGRRQQGELSTEQLNAFWLTSQKEMFGDAVRLRDAYGIWWSYIPHFLATPGYVYSYAFGELLVLALYARYQVQGEAFVEDYIALLAAGGTDSPEQLLASFDIDLNDPSFWHSGLQVIDEMLNEVEAINCQ